MATWKELKMCRDGMREAQIAGIMRLVEQHPFLDVCVGEIPPYSFIEAASHYPLCDGVLIIFDRKDTGGTKCQKTPTKK